jgi:hypothetical protein
MKNFDTRVYSVADFVEWNNNRLLDLSPDFQRRAVWTEKAKSYLVDTLLRGKPIPKIIITQELQSGRNVRIVVDGQQRLRAILEFVEGSFQVSRAHSPQHAGKTFSGLAQDVRNEFLKYELGVDLLFDPEYEDLLDIFARINTYTVTLNKQEKFNARYLGFFKQKVFSYGYKYVNYLIDGGVLTKAQVTRMAEAELSADLFVALIDEVQTNKNIESFYKLYEDDSGELDEASDRFDEIMSYIGEIYPASELKNTNWSRIQLFYTLFTAIGHMLYGLKPLDPKLRASLTPKTTGRARVRLDEVSSKYDRFAADLDSEAVPADYRLFIQQSRRGTTDTGARVGRTTFVARHLKQALTK